MSTQSKLAALAALALSGCTPDVADAPPAAVAPLTVEAPPPTLAPLNLPTAPDAMTPYLAVDGEALLLVWQAPVAEGHAVRFARMHAGQWSEPSTIASGAEVLANWADFPAVTASPDGTLVAHWLRKGMVDGAYDLELVRSRDGGASWTALGRPYTDTSPAEHGFVSYLADAGGVRLHWLDGRRVTGGHGGHHGGSTDLRTALVTADGVHSEVVIDDRVCDCCGTDAARAASGASLVVYRDRDEAERRDVSAAVFKGSSWTSGQPVGAEGWELRGCPVNGPAVTAAGNVIGAAWFTGAADGQRVRAAFIGPEGGVLGPPLEVAVATADARPVGRVDIASDDDGTAIVIWLSAEADGARVRARRIAPDGRVGASLDLGAAGIAAGFPRLVRAKDDFVAAWTGDAGIVAVRFPGEAIPPPGSVPVADPGPPPAPSTLPTFDLPDLAGQRVRSAELAGRPVLLNVWAAWCGPCREELPELAQIQAAHPDVAVLALSVDSVEAAAAVRKMSERFAPGLRVLHPDAGVAASLGVSALPRTFLFDGKGELCWGSTGAVKAADPGLRNAITACTAR